MKGTLAMFPLDLCECFVHCGMSSAAVAAVVKLKYMLILQKNITLYI